MSKWRPTQYNPAAHQQSTGQQQPYGQPTQQLGWPTAQHQPQNTPGSGGGGRRNRRKLGGILLGIIAALLIFSAGVAVGSGEAKSTGNISPAVTTSPANSAAGNTTAKALPTAKKPSKKHTKRSHAAVPSAKAPSAPAQTTHAAAPATSAPPPPPASTAPATCYPLTNGGNCYEPGEYCRNSDHGMSGVAGDGEAIICEDNDGWRWEPA
jgi:hypothetical protein